MIPSRTTILFELNEFADLVYDLGQRFLKGQVVKAVTARHRLEITLRALQHVDASHEFRVNCSLVDRWCSIYPALQPLIFLFVDCDQPGSCFSDRASCDRLREHIKLLVAEIAESAESAPLQHETGSFDAEA